MRNPTIEPTFKQHLAWQILQDNTTTDFLFGGGAGGGKSWLGCEWLLTSAIIYPDTRWFIAREKLTVLKRTTLITFFKVCKHHGIKKDEDFTYNAQTSQIKFTNGSVIDLLEVKFQPSDPLFEDLGSSEYTSGWIEEAGEVVFEAYDTLKTRIGRHMNDKYGLKAKMFLTCNPKKNWLYTTFYKPWKDGVLPFNYKFLQSLVDDNPKNEKNYKENLVNIKDKVKRERLLLGNWDYEDDQDSLISFDSLTDAFSNTVVKDGEKYLTVDVARKGQDSTVFSFWEGLELYKIEKYQKQDISNTTQKIKDFASQEKIPYSNILIDEDGVGGGVVDNLFGVKGFIAGSRPVPTASEIREKIERVGHLSPTSNFQNLKTQCAFKLSELINERKIAFRTSEYRDEIIEDLTAILRQKDLDKDGKLKIKSKEDVKVDLGRSPDLGDTILFRALFELVKDTEKVNNRQVDTEQKNYFMQIQNRQHLNSSK